LKLTHTQIKDEVKKSEESLEYVITVIYWSLKTDWTYNKKSIPDNLSAAWK
jgi:hypothetical protein